VPDSANIPPPSLASPRHREPGPSSSVPPAHVSPSADTDPRPRSCDEDDENAARWPLELSRFENGREESAHGLPYRYFGPSSNVRFVQDALSVRGAEQNIMERFISSARMRPEFWKPHPVRRPSREGAGAFACGSSCFY